MPEEVSCGETIAQTVDFASHPDIPALAFEAVDDLEGEITLQHRRHRDVVHEWTLADDALAVSGAREFTLTLPPDTVAESGRYVVQAAVVVDGQRYVWPAPPRRLTLVESVV